MATVRGTGAARALNLARWEGALEAPGCPVCRLASEAGREFLFHAVREGKRHPEVYEHIRDAGGFCEAHARILRQSCLARVGDRWSVARLYGWLLDDPELLRLPTRECPACEAATSYAEASLVALCELLSPDIGDAAFRTRFARGAGLCRGHFAAATEKMMNDREALRLLVAVQTRSWDMLSGQLQEYLRKHDYRFSREPKTAAEETSWVRAAAAISGEPMGEADGVC